MVASTLRLMPPLLLLLPPPCDEFGRDIWARTAEPVIGRC